MKKDPLVTGCNPKRQACLVGREPFHITQYDNLALPRWQLIEGRLEERSQCFGVETLVAVFGPWFDWVGRPIDPPCRTVSGPRGGRGAAVTWPS